MAKTPRFFQQKTPRARLRLQPVLLIDQYVRTGDEKLRGVFVTTLEKMALGGVYDQLAGGFHRYSVDERWIVPHFEKMCYDNSELLKNYVHAHQATGQEFFAAVARDIIRWMDEWLGDREHGGFYASQDADYSMDDDGDYFTWTLQEAQSVLTEEEARVACLHYDINEIGEMHHNPAKNVLYQRASVEEIGKRLSLPQEQIVRLLRSAKEKMYAARLKRPHSSVEPQLRGGARLPAWTQGSWIRRSFAANRDPGGRAGTAALHRRGRCGAAVPRLGAD